MYGIMSPERRKLVQKHLTKTELLIELWTEFPDDSELLNAAKKTREKMVSEYEEFCRRENNAK